MVGLRWMVLLGLWAGVVTWYWLAAVPLPPTSSVAHAGDLAVFPQRPSRHVILYHFRSMAPGGGRATGPLEFWDAKEGRVTGQLLSRDDQIIGNQSSWGAAEGYVLIRRDGQLVLIELESGQELGTFEDVPKAESYFVHEHRKELVVNADLSVSCFRFDRAKPKWIMRDASVEGLVDGDIQSVARWKISRSGKGRSRSGCSLIHLETGELDQRFEAVGNVWSATLSPDGKLALVRLKVGLANHAVYDVAAGKVLWKPTVAIDESLKFAPDGREVVIWQSTSLGPVDVRRLRAEDGQAIPGEPSAELLATLPAGAGKYLIRDAADLSGTRIQKWKDSLNQFWMKVGLHGLVMGYGKEIRLVDAGTGRDLGRLPRDSRFHFTDNQSTLITLTPTHLQTYVLPPRRDYGWLAEWIVGPPMVLFLTGQWWRVRRRGGALAL
ncbi:hypothetical protein Pan44_09290 [Caulifigura coniformis]|uniref:Uncharacterized protein n=1 Tax=Caulifigura coniformis TaxID=2527983 RepID=A0A517SA05_9PLAN|nr:hypothetical protein [Caulifigura coniformis]QDT52916.1 hypothetical protein Pan44_09290 [Caulifigura coniformis]